MHRKWHLMGWMAGLAAKGYSGLSKKANPRLLDPWPSLLVVQGYRAGGELLPIPRESSSHIG